MAEVSLDLSKINQISGLLRDSKWTAGELRAGVAGRQTVMTKAGVKPGSRIMIAHGGSPEFFVDLFSAWSLGACVACVNPDLTSGELANLAAFTEPTAVIVGAGTRTFSVSAKVTMIEATARADASADRGKFLICNNPEDPALILFTSGTTGDPKGVVHSFGSLSARISLNHQHISRDVLSRTLCVLPTHFGHGLIGNCLTPLLAGGHLFLAAGGGVAGAAQLATQLTEHDITFMSSVPAFWKVALKASRPPGRATLRRVNVGSAPVAADLVRAIAAWAGTDDVCNMYGITETANWIAGGSLHDRAAEDGLIGPMWGGTAAVRTGDSVAENGEGEIVVKTPSLMSGYFRRPDLTNAVVKDGWYHTGDTGSVDGNGWLRLTGRLKNEINRGGMKVSPEEVDLLLERHPAVAEACAFGLPDSIAGETVAIAIRLIPDQNLNAAELRAWCLERVRRDCVPERWFFVDEIPKTDRGKLNRDRVRDACVKAEDK